MVLNLSDNAVGKLLETALSQQPPNLRPGLFWGGTPNRGEPSVVQARSNPRAEMALASTRECHSQSSVQWIGSKQGGPTCWATWRLGRTAQVRPVRRPCRPAAAETLHQAWRWWKAGRAAEVAAALSFQK